MNTQINNLMNNNKSKRTYNDKIITFYFQIGVNKKNYCVPLPPISYEEKRNENVDKGENNDFK